MAMAEVINAIQTIATGVTMDIRPAVGQDWEITHLGSSVWTAAGAPNDTPRLTAGIFDGVSGPALVLNSGNLRGWNHTRHLLINRATYLRLTNPPAGGNQNLSIAGKITRDYGAGTSSVITTIVAGVAGAGGTITVRPPVGQDWIITDFGSNWWVGAPPNALPQITVDLTDGVSFATLMSGANAIGGWYREFDIHINNTIYLRITNNNAGLAALAYVGKISRDYGAGASQVVSAVATLGIGGIMTVRPPVNNEWRITMIGASAWIGGAPNQIPDVSVNLTDGVIASLLARNSDFALWFGTMNILINRTVWLTITDTSGAGGRVGVSALKTKQY